jgi:hypothetical protein
MQYAVRGFVCAILKLSEFAGFSAAIREFDIHIRFAH